MARAHFGPTPDRDPACTITARKLRLLEDELESYRHEDTALHREIAGLRADHAAALRREEEKGYARGLRDAVKAQKPSDCSDDPNSCPDNEGTGCHCSRERNALVAEQRPDPDRALCSSCHGQGCEGHLCDDGRMVCGPECERCHGSGFEPEGEVQ